MKADELRIGNWVNNKGLPRKIYSISPLSIDFLISENHKQIHTQSYKPRGIEPIALTPEMLEKAGFKYINGRDDLGCYIDIGRRIKINIDSRTSVISLRSTSIKYQKWGEIQYIHQLQNLYYCLTGTELKIELTPTTK